MHVLKRSACNTLAIGALQTCYLAELLSQSLLGDSQRPHASDTTRCLHLVHVQTRHAFICNQLRAERTSEIITLNSYDKRAGTELPFPDKENGTLSSARMFLSFMMS